VEQKEVSIKRKEDIVFKLTSFDEENISLEKLNFSVAYPQSGIKDQKEMSSY